MLRDDDTALTKPETHYRGTGVWPAVVAGLVVAAAVVIFVAQNTTATSLEFLWFDFRTSPPVLVLATATPPVAPAMLVLATALMAVAAAIVVGAWLRARRRRTLRQQEELDHLRRVPPISAV